MGICIALVLFPVISYAWAAFCQWYNKPEGEVPMKSEETPKQTEMKDINLKLDVKDTDEAIGIDVENTPTKLSNVQLQMTAQRAGSVTGMRITSNNATTLSSITINCSCGNTFNSTTTCGYKEVLKCPKCGRIHDDL